MRMLTSGSVVLVVGVLAAVVACSRKEEASTVSAPAATATASAHEHDHAPSSATAWAADHEHKAPHGGRVHTAGDGHVEVKIVQGTARVWLLDHDLHSVSGKGVTATIRIRDEDPVRMIFDASADVFTAQVKGTSPGLQVDTNVELIDSSGKKSSARFFLTPE